jgi:hypothetical protein
MLEAMWIGRRAASRYAARCLKYRTLRGHWPAVVCPQEKGAGMMKRHPRLAGSAVPFSLVLLFTTLFTATVAEGVDRKVLLENFTRSG